jgi:hypothetical protein
MASIAPTPCWALDVAGAARVEIGHGQGQQLAHQVIQDSGIDVDGDEAEHVLLHQAASEHEESGQNHSEHGELQESEVAFDDHFVDHNLSEHGKDELESADDTGQKDGLQQGTLVFGEEWQHPGEGGSAFGRLSECGSVVKQGSITGPFLLEFGQWDSADASTRRVRHANGLVADFDQNHPVVAFPVDDRRQGHQRKVAAGNLQCP